MPAAVKVDLYKEHKREYAAPKKPVLLDVPPAVYLVVTGSGRPGQEEYQKKLGALYTTAYTLKFESKAAGRDYAVCKLEGIYWTDAGGPGFDSIPMDEWHWDLIVRTPDFITTAQLDAARNKAIAKGSPEASEVKLATIHEGMCVQMLHVGPYAEERKSLEMMCAHAREAGYEFTDRHHEIYLSDPRRVDPAKLKTILRCPINRIAAK